MFGSIYLLLGIAGFVAPGIVATLIGHDALINARALLPDNVVHVVLSAAFLAVGWSATGVPGRMIGAGSA